MEKPDNIQVALVSLNSVEYGPNRVPYFQVTLNPDHVSGEYIRFGDTSGDELVGWFDLEEIDLHQVFYELDTNDALQYTGQDSGIQMLTRLDEYIDQHQLKTGKLQMVEGDG